MARSERHMANPFKIRRRVLFGDCDPAGFIYTPRIAYFVVEATHEFLSVRLGAPAVRRILELGILPPARALSFEFLSPLTWDDEIDIHVAVAEVRSHSFSFAVEALTSKGYPAFKAQLTQVCVSLETKRPVEVPETLRRALLD